MHIPREKARWIILFFSIFLLFGSYYCFELPAALKDSLEVRFSGYLSSEEYEYFFNSLFSVYSLPNIILPFLNGYLVDKIGLKGVLFSLVLLVMLGQIIFAIAISKYMFYLMVFGRFIFGIGSESLFVVENILLIKYFRGKELSFAIGLNLAMANLGGVLNMYFTPKIAANYATTTAVWTGAYLCIFSLVCIIIVLFLDAKLNELDSPNLIDQNEIAKYEARDVKIQDFQAFEITFWYLALSCFFLYSCIISWMNIGSSYIIDKWFQNVPAQEGEISAGNYLSLMWLTAVISGPSVGYVVDNYGFRLKILILGTMISTLSMILFIFIYPIVPVILLGLAYSLGVASIYPSIPYVVPAESLGKANGLVTSMQNLGFSLYPYVIATIKVQSGSYDYAQIFLTLSTIMSIIFACLAARANQIGNYTQELNDAPSEKEHENEALELRDLRKVPNEL